MELKNKNLSVIGLGKTGVAVANFLSQRGAFVTVMDSKPREQLLKFVEQLSEDVNTNFQNSEPPSDTELIVLSPGVDVHSSFLQMLVGPELRLSVKLNWRTGSTASLSLQ